MVQALATDYDIDVYSQHPANADFAPQGFCFVSAPGYLKLGLVKWWWIILHFWQNHRKSKYRLAYAFWAHPAGVWGAVAKTISGVPLLIHLQGGEVVSIPAIGYGALRNPVKKKIITWALHRADAVVALTEYQKRLAQHLADVPYEIVPFGVDPSKFVYHHKRLQGVRKFLHVGSLIPVKDQLTLLHCFALYQQKKQAHLTIVGEGYLEGYLRQVCSELKISDMVSFAGFHRHTELDKFYAEADILLHTSLYEGQCLAVAEAFASGVLVAGTKVGLIADMGEKSCLTVDIGDAKKLAEQLLLLTDETYQTKVHEAKRWSEANTFCKEVEKIRSLIDSTATD
ncbi:MAG: glycosyltransferase [Flammeovirgaceae bacterium]